MYARCSSLWLVTNMLMAKKLKELDLDCISVINPWPRTSCLEPFKTFWPSQHFLPQPKNMDLLSWTRKSILLTELSGGWSTPWDILPSTRERIQFTSSTLSNTSNWMSFHFCHCWYHYFFTSCTHWLNVAGAEEPKVKLNDTPCPRRNIIHVVGSILALCIIPTIQNSEEITCFSIAEVYHVFGERESYLYEKLVC